MDIEWVLFAVAAFIPPIMLTGTWWLLRNRHVALCFACAGIATLVSLPAALEFNLFVIGLFHGWDFFWHAGDHSPGIGIANIFVFLSWPVCLVAWCVMLVFALANKPGKSRPAPSQH